MKKLLVTLMLMATAACSGTQLGQQPRVSDQSLGYGSEGTVQAKTGDTVYSIARRHNVPMSAVIATNGLKPPYVLQPGQLIKLPDGAAAGSNTATVSQLPYDRSVGASDLGGSTAPTTSSSSSLLPLDVQPQSAYDSPVATAPLDGAPPTQPTGRTDMVLTPLGPSTTPTPGEEPELANTPTSILPKDATTERASNSAAAPRQGIFSWPLEGPVISSYGAGAGGATNAGINITAPKGTPVQAAAGGTVVHASDDAGNVGKLVLIRHPDGYVTSYGHLDRILVEKDTVVGSGDAIGTVGESGGVKAPQLHFEIRQGERPVDPAGYLPAKS